jgi:hypothetical protein
MLLVIVLLVRLTDARWQRLGPTVDQSGKRKDLTIQLTQRFCCLPYTVFNLNKING